MVIWKFKSKNFWSARTDKVLEVIHDLDHF